jgi:hypothetical protein
MSPVAFILVIPLLAAALLSFFPWHRVAAC